MTLLVYRNGILAADTGSTRNDSREEFHKIFVADSDEGTLAIAYTGYLHDISAHWKEVLRRLRNGEDVTAGGYPKIYAHGIAVQITPDEAPHRVYTFHCSGDSGGVWLEEQTNMAIDGADTAVTAAKAIASVLPREPAAGVVRKTAQVNSACDTQYGVDSIDCKTGRCIGGTLIRERV